MTFCPMVLIEPNVVNEMADASTQQRSSDYIGGVMVVVVNPRTNCAIKRKQDQNK